MSTSLQKFKTNSWCVGGRHYSGTSNIIGDITPKGVKLLKGKCTRCYRNKSVTVSGSAVEAEGLKDFLNTWARLLRLLVKKC